MPKDGKNSNYLLQDRDPICRPAWPKRDVGLGRKLILHSTEPYLDRPEMPMDQKDEMLVLEARDPICRPAWPKRDSRASRKLVFRSAEPYIDHPAEHGNLSGGAD